MFSKLLSAIRHSRASGNPVSAAPFKNWMIALVISATPALAQSPRTIEMTVDGLVCAFCAQGIEKKLRKLEATADVFVSLEQRIVAVALKGEQDISDTVLKELLTDAGYTLREVKRSDQPLDAIRRRAPS